VPASCQNHPHPGLLPSREKLRVSSPSRRKSFKIQSPACFKGPLFARVLRPGQAKAFFVRDGQEQSAAIKSRKKTIVNDSDRTNSSRV
jgi:hypothetical protein